MKLAKAPSNARLTEGDVGKTLVRLTLPMIAGMIGVMAFNIVDTFFISLLGTIELAAISFTFPIVMFIGNLANGIGIGVSAVVSRAIGKGDRRKVVRLATDSLSLALVFALVFVTLGLLTIDPLFSALGASPDTLPLIREYMTIWYFGVFFVIIPMIGNNSIRATGDTKTPALIMIFAGTLNAVLDPLLIFGFGSIPSLGMQGAAMATVIARASTMALAFYVLYFRDRMISFRLPSFRQVIGSWRSILYIGLPASGTRLLVPIAIGVITSLFAMHGHEAVAGFGVASRVEFIVLAVLMALSMVLAPFVGQNWGAGKRGRVIKGISSSNRFSLLWGAGAFLVLAASGSIIAPIFSSDPQVITMIIVYFMTVPLSYGLQGILLVSTTSLNVLNKPLHSAAIIIFQMVALYIPLAYLGSHLFGIPGILIGITLAHCVAGIASHIVLRRFLARGGGKNPS